MATASSDTQEAQQLHNRPDGAHEDIVYVSDGVGTKTRLPRWTKRETFVLIQGKKAAENRLSKACRSPAAMWPAHTESKWESVSSYCRERGVNRGPIQCQKRWGNMLSDYRKLKVWESRKGEAESYWMMRNELRRERRLPGFFSREVFDVLDGREFATDAIPLAQVTVRTETNNSDGDETADSVGEEEELDEAKAGFDISLHHNLEGISWPDCEGYRQSDILWSSWMATPIGISEGKHSRSTTRSGSMSQEGWKRRRVASRDCGDRNIQDRLIKVLERNNDMLNSQLEAQRMNSELDRIQRKEHNDSLVGIVNNFIEVLYKIADKI